MKKTPILVISLVMALAVIASLVAGCSSASTPTATTPAVTTPATQVAASQTPKATTRTITYMTGRSVTIPTPENIKRVAVLTSPQIIEMYIIGAQDKLCAVTNAVKQWTFLQKIDPKVKDLPAVRAQAAQINIESLLQANPDFCMGSEMDMQVVEKSTTIPTLRIATNSTSNFLEAQKTEVKFFGMVFGKDAQAAKYTAYLDNTTATVKAATADLTKDKKLKVYLGFNADHLTTFGGDTFMNEWIETAGCVNSAQPITSLGGKEGGLATVSMEQILSWNPDIVCIDNGKPQDVYNDPNWAKIPAVVNKKVYSLPVGMFIWSRTSSEAAAMLPKWLSLTAYPDRFKDTTIDKELKKFFADIIGYNLTDDDVKTILYPQGQ
jgi:iron complex transport system substrate-binding protein